MIFLAQVAEAPFFSLAPGSEDILGGWLICFLTLAVFSFLYKDNPFYKIAEHAFVGLGTAYFTLQYYEEGLLGPLYEYIEAASAAAEVGATVELGGLPIAPSLAIGLRLAALVLAVMLLVRLVAPTSWAPRWPLAIMVGVYAALKMTGETQSKLVLMLGNVMKSVEDPNTVAAWSDAPVIELWSPFVTLSRIILFAGMMAALAHFIFTFKRTRMLAGISRYGIITLMVTFGAMFGFTVLGRIALLIERVADLKTYTAPAYNLAGAEGLLGTFTSPPLLITYLIVVVLLLGLKGKGDSGTT
jgi:hypothetical protein